MIIEDAYRLSQMQEGILFETQYVSDPELYFQQERYCVRGSLHIDAFKKAWQGAIQRYPILRTIFVWKDIEAPIQIVRQRMTLPWNEDDWQNDSVGEQEQRFEQFCIDDRARGFDLEQGPLIRFTLIRLTSNSYYFLWSFHHILLDGWSTPIILDEVMTSYYAYCTGHEPILSVTKPYKEYINWLQLQENAQAEQYWRELLRGFSYPTQLAIENTHAPLDRQPIFAHKTCLLPAAFSSAIRLMAHQHKLTVNTLMQSAWALLLSTYSGEDDVVFGVTVSGRSIPLPGIESMVGLFINALPIRVKIDTQVTVIPWLQAIQEQQLQSLQYEQSPLVKIQKWSEIPKDQALFKSLLIFQNYPFESTNGATQDILELLPLDTFAQTNYPLTLTITPGEEIVVQFSYQCHLFDAPSIARLLKHFQAVLEAIITNPAQRIGNLSLLTAAEREKQLVEWNQTAMPFPHNQCIHELFEAQVTLCPQATAVRFGQAELTYTQLNQRANQVAHSLRERGVKPDTLVGLCVERSLEMVVGILGILKAGGAYVPLDPTYPSERLAYMLADTGITLLLTQQQLIERLPSHSAEVLCLDADWTRFAAAPMTNLMSGVTPHHLAYVIYTSGSTGQPKGVMIDHNGLTNYLSWSVSAYNVARGQGSLLHSSLAFDLSVTGLFAPLLVGQAVRLLPEEKDIDALGNALRQYRDLSLIKLTPAHLVLLAQQLERENVANCTSAFIIGGEALLHEHVAFWRKRAPQTRLINEYGPTETVVGCCTYELPADEIFVSAGPVPIGRPIANTQIYLLDQNLNPVPIGVPGELYIGGVGVARGYLKRPELTAERFVPDPFSKVPGVRLYKTGDQARYLSTGEIEYLGRNDSQVKIRGFRIELGEIEAILSQHPAVQECVMIAREDTPGEKRLVAYIVPNPGHVIAIADLRRHVSAKLPKYMLPAFFVTLPALPLTSNGKLDRRALPAPDIHSNGSGKPYVAPQNPAEVKLALIWEQVLNIAKVGIHDNFFEIGGNSLHVVRIVAKAAKSGVAITVKQIFQYPTIAELARVHDQTQITAEQNAVIGLVPALDFHRRLLADAKKMEAHANLFHLKMHIALAPDRLAKAVEALMQYHDGLRMVCAPPDSSYPLTIGSSLPVERIYTRVDTTHLTNEELDEMIAIQLDTIHLTPLELQAGPLFKVFHYDSGMMRPSQLVLVVHSLLADVEAWQTIINDLLDAYQQLTQSNTILFPSKGTSYRQWAERLTTYVQSDRIVRELGFWVEQSRCSIPPLPRDRDDGLNLVGTTLFVDRELTVEETSVILHEASHKLNVRVDSILLTAVMLAIEEWSKQHVIQFHLSTHGRVPLFDDMDISRTVGAFVSSYPIVLDIGEARQIDTVAQTIQPQLNRVPNQGVGYGLLHALRHTSDADPLRAMGVPEILFGYISEYENDSEHPQCDIIGPYTTTPHDIEMPRNSIISILVMSVLGRLHIQWSFSSNMYDVATIELLMDAMIATLRNVAASLKS